jgi:DNA polymerase epsilon subunit 4
LTCSDNHAANAVLHHDNLEFLEDIVPKTATLRQVKDQAAATRAKLRGETNKNVPANGGDDATVPNGKKQKTMANGSGSSPGERGHKVNGGGSSGTNALDMSSVLIADEDPSAQLELEMRQANRGHEQGQSGQGGDGDVDMTGTG